ncbi:MAG: hypothetical protein JSV24_09660 [Bacteroidales bacterium]|nr:MAG: hypothetical protein JSV24_09660 [Bacteroidales bacterium]
MNKYFLFFIFILITAGTKIGSGQDFVNNPFRTPEYSEAARSYQQSTVESYNMKAIYFEILGNGFAYSFNFDIRFTRSDRGVGGRLGIGYTDFPEGDSLLTVPIMINYLLGKNSKYFEIGGGIVYVNGKHFLKKLGSTDDVIYGTFTFAFRYQPLNNGFFFKAGLTPVLGTEGFIPYWVGLSLGYAFGRQ